uniref:Uncharacterized protein n=1 Tax=Avena sativa TaxID=4498 RepID=A0ACD5ZP22_AVESA
MRPEAKFERFLSADPNRSPRSRHCRPALPFLSSAALELPPCHTSPPRRLLPLPHSNPCAAAVAVPGTTSARPCCLNPIRSLGHRLPRCEEERPMGGTDDPASAQPLEEQGLAITARSSSSLQAEAVTLHTAEASPTSRHSSTGSPFWAWLKSDWGLKFYIRVDHEESFHTYPDVGGPFQSLQEAENAIDSHLHGRRVPEMCKEQAGVSQVEMGIRACLYWPDGIRKKSKLHVIERIRDENHRFVQALIDNYNKDHNIDITYELRDVVQYQIIFENQKWYYHFNFTAKTKGANDLDSGIDNLFFAEVKSSRQGEHEELVVSCFCMVKPANTGHCYGCKNNGIVDMKHPNKASAYTGGHLDVHIPLTCSKRELSDEDVCAFISCQSADIFCCLTVNCTCVSPSFTGAC